MKAQAMKDLHDSLYLKILSDCTRLKARAILREFQISYIPSVNPY